MDRIALLPVDNQTGDATLDWVRDAVPAMISGQLTGVGNLVPVRAASSVEATGLGAQHMVHGYVERRGATLHFSFSIEDAGTHRLRPVAADGDVVAAATRLSREIDPGARPFSTSQVAAVEAWARRDFARAVELDPNFGSAWVAWAETLMSVPGQAVEIADRGLKQGGLQSPLDRAELGLLAARLHGDSAAVIRATDQLVSLRGKDAAFLQTIAAQESEARRFERSVRFYRELLKVDPENGSLYNLLGYAQFFAGDLAGSRASLERYGKTEGQQANALDSEGEVLFMAGKFPDAERYFLRAHEASPAMLQGGDLLKAAYAHWLGGDLPGADAQFEKYLSFRGQVVDVQGVWRRSVWEYSTGRAESAVARLKMVTGPTAAVAQSQLQVWANAANLKQDLATLERSYQSTQAAADGLVRTLYARELWKAGRKDEAAKLIEWWPLPETGEPLLQSLTYPLYLELRRNLGK